MRWFNRDKRFLIFSSLFLVVLGSFVVANFVASPASFSFEGEPTVVEPNSFTMQNSYVEHNIVELEYIFVPNSALSSSGLSTNSVVFNDSNIEQIGNGSSVPISFDFEIPTGLDAIDNKFDPVVWTVGEIELSGLAVNISNFTDNHSVEDTIIFDVEIENNLEFYKDQVEVDVSGEDPKNTSSGKTRTVQDGDTVSIKITYENTFTENIEFEKEDIKVVLYVGGEELDRQTGKDSVDDGEMGEAEVEFDVEDLDVGDYDVELELTGITEHGGRHGEIFEFKIDVEEETSAPDVVADFDGDGVRDELDLCPGTNILCDVDEAGCEMDPDRDGICNGIDQTPDGEQKFAEKTDNVAPKQTSNEKDTSEEKEKVVEKKDGSDGGSTGSFFFGLIVGFVGAALFFTLTKV